MSNHRSALTSLVAVVAAALGGMYLGRRQGRHHLADDLWDQAAGVQERQRARAVPVAAQVGVRAKARAKADEVAASRRAGSEQDRQEPSRPAVGLDVSRLESVTNALEPVVQYLTYIQSRRGEDASLLFIRYDDIDAMAELDGEPSEELLERLDQLGVVVSAN